MSDPAREKYVRLMSEIEALEERIESLLADEATMTDSPNPDDARVLREELDALRERLASARNELARLSDGCGRPRRE